MSSCIRAMSAVSMATSEPAAPIAIPMFDLARAGASLIPSPTMATSPNLFLIVSRMFNLSSGSRLEYT